MLHAWANLGRIRAWLSTTILGAIYRCIAAEDSEDEPTGRAHQQPELQIILSITCFTMTQDFSGLSLSGKTAIVTGASR